MYVIHAWTYSNWDWSASDDRAKRLWCKMALSGCTRWTQWFTSFESTVSVYIAYPLIVFSEPQSACCPIHSLLRSGPARVRRGKWKKWSRVIPVWDSRSWNTTGTSPGWVQSASTPFTVTNLGEYSQLPLHSHTTPVWDNKSWNTLGECCDMTLSAE